MSIHTRHLTSAEREAVVFQYMVETGYKPDGRLLDVSTQ